MRYDLQGNVKNDFVLNWDPYKSATILITGENFGCGSSREHAPWSLLDFGFRCIIAPSFADIFYNNCFKNGILPIRLDQNDVDNLMVEAENKKLLFISLEDQLIKSESDKSISFDIEPFRKKCLLEGLDDIALTLKKDEKIKSFETILHQSLPWII